MGGIEAQLHRRGNFIDILTTRSGGADEAFFQIRRGDQKLMVDAQAPAGGWLAFVNRFVGIAHWVGFRGWRVSRDQAKDGPHSRVPGARPGRGPSTPPGQPGGEPGDTQGQDHQQDGTADLIEEGGGQQEQGAQPEHHDARE